MIVVDASVAVKWLIEEPGSAAAAAVLESDRGVLFAPDLVSVEVAGALSRRVRDGRFSPEDARAGYDKWSLLLDQESLTLKRTDEFLTRAFEIALEAKHALPDCVYLACAELLGVPVLTADHAMYERGRRVYDRIELLPTAA